MLRNIQGLPFAVTFLLLVVPGLLYPGLARAASDTLDQSQTSNGYYRAVLVNAPRGQIFTAGLNTGLSGYLDRVSVYLENYQTNPVTGPITVSIQATTGGIPSGSAIGRGTIPLSAIPAAGTHGAWVDVAIDGAFVIAGSQYALVLSLSPSGEVLWYSGNDVYAAGYEVYYEQYPDGTVWHTSSSYDAMFKTYVIADTLDDLGSQSQTSGTGGGTHALGPTPTAVVGQTFTVGLYGRLDRISVYLTNSSASPAPITITLLQVTSTGLPAIGTQVASGTIPADAIPKPLSRAWVSATMTPLIVTPGAQYAVLLQTGGSGTQWVLVSDVYSRGTGVISSGTRWITASYDFAFRTYVMPPTVDQAQPAFDDLKSADMFGWATPREQHFTAQMSGRLEAVYLKLCQNYNWSGTEDIGVSVYAVDSGILIGSGTIPANRVGCIYWWGTPGWVQAATFSVGYITAGEEYSIKVQVLGKDCYYLWYKAGGVYSFETWVMPYPGPITTAPGPGIMPCVNGVCPAASGGFNPADLTEGVTSRFQFQERPNGTVQGVLNFNDPRPDGIVLRGCTAESAACALTVTGLICTDAHSMIVGGTYTPRGGATTRYSLTLNGVSNEPGTIKLSAGEYTFTLTLDGIANVTCPPKPGP